MQRRESACWRRAARLGLRRGSAGLPEATRCMFGTARSETPVTRPGVEIRRLVYSDLPAVLAIERRSFPTPWSLAMFVLELSKPSGICLAAATQDGLVGYLVCSRYADVWHLMNVAVIPSAAARRREHVLHRLIEGAGADARYTLEVRASNAARSRCTSASGSAAGHRRATTTTTARTP